MRPARPIFPDIDFTAPSSSSSSFHFHPRAKGNVTFVTYAPRGLLSSLCAKARRVERERERGLLSVGSTALPPSPLSIYSAIIVNVPQRAVNEPTTTDRLAEGYRRVEHVFARWRRDLLENPPNVCASRRGRRFLTRCLRRKEFYFGGFNSVIFYRKIRSEL